MARTAYSADNSKLGMLPTLVLVVAVLYVARDILVPISVAILLAFLLAPAVVWLERRKLGRFLSVALVMIAALSAIGGVTWILEHQFVEVVSKLPNYRQNIQDKIRRVKGGYETGIKETATEVEATLTAVSTTNPASQPSAVAVTTPGRSPRLPVTVIAPEGSDSWSLSKILSQYSGLVLSPLATAGLILVFVVFILVNRRDLRDRILRLVGDARMHVTTQALDDAATRIAHYLLMQSAINAVYGVCVGTGLWIIGAFSAEGRFPDVLLWALLAMLFRFIPYLGPWIGAALPIVVSLVVFNSAAVFFATLGLYVVLEVLASNVLEPWLYGSSTGISAVAVLGSAVFWTWLWGPIGLLLSTPLTVCLVVLGKYVPRLHFLAVLLGDGPPLEPYVRIYQRLLSLDQEEAAELLHQYWKEHGLERVYDEVMIPALALAESDRGVGIVDADRELFVCQAMRDFVEELADAQRKRNGPAPLVPETAVTVLCLPAQSEADEIAGLMLAQLLDLKGQRAIVASRVSLAGEMIELIQSQEAAVVCISAFPPAALAHSRYLHKRLRAKFPDLPTVVGLWTGKSAANPESERASFSENVRFVTGLKAALVEIQEMAQSSLLQHAHRG